MFFGFVMGLIRGAFLGGIILAALSLYFEMPTQKSEATVEPQVAPEQITDAVEVAQVQEAPEGEVAERQADVAEVTEVAPVAVPSEDSSSEVEMVASDVSAPNEPETSAQPQELANMDECDGTIIDGVCAQEIMNDGMGLGEQLASLSDENETIVISHVSNDALDNIIVNSPLKFQAEPLDGPDEKIMSVVIVIDQDDMLGPETIVAFPQPVSFAISSDVANYQEKIQVIRDLGYEAFLLPVLGDSKALSDFKTSLENEELTRAEVFGLMEPFAGAFQQTRPITDFAIDFAKANRRGLLFYATGPSAAQTMAQREGVPAFSIFRTLPSEEANPDAVRRVMNQGTMRAASGEPVIVVGRLTQSLVSGLILWGLEDPSRGVALVPSSQILAMEVEPSDPAQVAVN